MSAIVTDPERDRDHRSPSLRRTAKTRHPATFVQGKKRQYRTKPVQEENINIARKKKWAACTPQNKTTKLPALAPITPQDPNRGDRFLKPGGDHIQEAKIGW